VRFFIVASFVFLFCLQLKGQQVIVRGGFFADSISIGEKAKYYLTARYPSRLNVLFPDTTYKFQPFEYESRQYFATETRDSISYDSVIYSLSTFEVDRHQFLGLPVFAITKQDTIFYNALADTILITQMVAQVPDSLSVDKLPLKMNTAYQKVPFLFNYPIVIIAFASICFVVLIVFLVFGRKISRHFRLKRLKKNHQKFIYDYTAKLELVKTKSTIAVTESTLFTWKKYLEQLEGWPYTKLTTRETVLMEKDRKLGDNLHEIDKAIYGHEAPVLQPLLGLRDYAEQKFIKKLDQVKHGK
jgi:hypothetical protein